MFFPDTFVDNTSQITNYAISAYHH